MQPERIIAAIKNVFVAWRSQSHFTISSTSESTDESPPRPTIPPDEFSIPAKAMAAAASLFLCSTAAATWWWSKANAAFIGLIILPGVQTLPCFDDLSIGPCHSGRRGQEWHRRWGGGGGGVFPINKLLLARQKKRVFPSFVLIFGRRS